jgi:hypothetical protein
VSLKFFIDKNDVLLCHDNYKDLIEEEKRKNNPPVFIFKLELKDNLD